MKIVFFNYSMKKGGAERVISILANFWAAKGWEVAIVTIDSSTPQYPLHEGVQWIPMRMESESRNILQALWVNWKRYNHFLSIIKSLKPDAVISFNTTCNVFTGFAGRRVKAATVMADRCNPYLLPVSQIWMKLQKVCSKYASLLVVQTEGVKRFYTEYACPIRVIPNPLDLDKVIPSPRTGKIMVATGRLDPQKQFDKLIPAFGAADNEGWELWILGEGKDRPMLEKLIASEGLEGKVKLLGLVENVYQYLSQGTIFVMSSKFEGYPNALIEAMAAGLPVISTDCEFGPAEIIDQKENGVLVPVGDHEAMVDALNLLIHDPDFRNRIGQNALESRGKHDIFRIVEKWEEVLGEVIPQREVSQPIA